ncbi:ribosome-associated GTPase EngA [Jannaschia rubra]|uniref:Ribosome-associated GTPase EngA n=2 Tax=Jannaschia rubra TaxID=282197 RepID=A0A0M6XQI4_9RHOB|nr:ribosome-associated GTPase EngA [Jannaschia rubra]SFG79755.1 Dynamin family protein [Jannaschia rubra]
MDMSRIEDGTADAIALPGGATPAPTSTTAPAPAPVAIPPAGLSRLAELRDEIDALREVLRDIEAIGGDDIARKVRQMIHELDTFEPGVTMIGQIKSGKTTLVNAMAGHPGLLPADVNPWTSVVTSLHLGVPRHADAPAASFRFFDRDEWDHLVRNGGRIGDLSARAGADDEVHKLRRQVAAMRDKTRERLGRRFELLLGQSHDYAAFDDALVKRYVCMGDDFDALSREEQQGQFADITRSADLYLGAGGLPVPLCIRDTPGVNDTFMMREQITIRALRDSRTCVVVLSAHQALSTTDMGLIRLISNVKSRQILIFVNRIDELSDPATQVPEIRASLADTLARAGAPEDIEVIFGSAAWANAVLTGGLDDMDPEAAMALQNQAAATPGVAGMDAAAMAWTLSGVPALYGAIGDRLVEGPAARLLSGLRRRAANYVSGLRASGKIVSLRSGATEVRAMEAPRVEALLEDIRLRCVAEMEARLDRVFADFAARIDQVHARFLERALESLLQHLETHGEGEVWNYSPDGLRMLLRTSCQVMRRNYARACEEGFAIAAMELTTAYGRIFSVEVENFMVDPPEAPETPPPVALAQTLALDLRTSWWKGWWGRRRGYRALARGFRDLIAAETAPMVDELKVRQAGELRIMGLNRLEGFLAEQRVVLSDICRKTEIGLDELHGLFGVTAQDEREQLFELILDELDVDGPEDME